MSRGAENCAGAVVRSNNSLAKAIAASDKKFGSQAQIPA
jgi:hypothetical protein